MVFGFIRNEADTKYCLFIPSSIIDLLIFYVFDTKIKWTHSYPEYATISQDGSRLIGHIDSNYMNDAYYVSATSDTGWRNGICQWSVQLVKRGKSSGAQEEIGVVTDYQSAIMKNKTLYNLGYHLYYDSNNRAIFRDRQKLKDVGTIWNEGDIMVINVDCNKWKMSFFLNDQNLGTFKLTRKKKYYPAISIPAVNGYELKLL